MSWACLRSTNSSILRSHRLRDHPMTDRSTKRTGPKLLTGGNPQFPKGEGDGPDRRRLAVRSATSVRRMAS